MSLGIVGIVIVPGIDEEKKKIQALYSLSFVDPRITGAIFYYPHFPAAKQKRIYLYSVGRHSSSNCKQCNKEKSPVKTSLSRRFRNITSVLAARDLKSPPEELAQEVQINKRKKKEERKYLLLLVGNNIDIKPPPKKGKKRKEKKRKRTA